MPGLLILCFVAGFILLKIPTMTASLFSGHVGGHGIGAGGLITAAILRADLGAMEVFNGNHDKAITGNHRAPRNATSNSTAIRW